MYASPTRPKRGQPDDSVPAATGARAVISNLVMVKIYQSGDRGLPPARQLPAYGTHIKMISQYVRM